MNVIINRNVLVLNYSLLGLLSIYYRLQLIVLLLCARVLLFWCSTTSPTSRARSWAGSCWVCVLATFFILFLSPVLRRTMGTGALLPFFVVREGWDRGQKGQKEEKLKKVQARG